MKNKTEKAELIITFTPANDPGYAGRIGAIKNLTEIKKEFWSSIHPDKKDHTEEKISQEEQSIKIEFGHYLVKEIAKQLALLDFASKKYNKENTIAPTTISDTLNIKVENLSYGSLSLTISIDNTEYLAELFSGSIALFSYIIEACAPTALVEASTSTPKAATQARISNYSELENEFNQHNKKTNATDFIDSNNQSSPTSNTENSTKKTKRYNLCPAIYSLKNPYIAIFLPVAIAIYLLYSTQERLYTERQMLEKRLEGIEKRERAYIDDVTSLLHQLRSTPKKATTEKP
jgi:hypothetical protein